MTNSYNKANKFLNNKNYDKAIKPLKNCIEEYNDQPSYSSYCANQLALIYDRGFSDQGVNILRAKQYYHQAYLIKEDDVNTFNYANYLLKFKNYSEAIPILNKCLVINASENYQSWCANQLGIIFEHGHDVEVSQIDALEYYKMAYKYNKDDFFNLYNLAMIYNKAKAFNKNYCSEAKNYISECSQFKSSSSNDNNFIAYTNHCKGLLEDYTLSSCNPTKTPEFMGVIEGKQDLSSCSNTLD